MLVSQTTSADLSFTTPPDFCCNCGARGKLDFVETPLRKTNYFFLFGSELTLNESFPYCKRCRGTAKRVRQGCLSKILAACMVAAAVFLILVLTAESLPKAIAANLFYSSLIIAAALTISYFYTQEWSRKGRTYYQPVSLVDARIEGNYLGQVWLRFYNPDYAQVFANANPEAIAAGLVRIVIKEKITGVNNGGQTTFVFSNEPPLFSFF